MQPTALSTRRRSGDSAVGGGATRTTTPSPKRRRCTPSSPGPEPGGPVNKATLPGACRASIPNLLDRLSDSRLANPRGGVGPHVLKPSLLRRWLESALVPKRRQGVHAWAAAAALLGCAFAAVLVYTYVDVGQTAPLPNPDAAPAALDERAAQATGLVSEAQLLVGSLRRGRTGTCNVSGPA